MIIIIIIVVISAWVGELHRYVRTRILCCTIAFTVFYCIICTVITLNFAYLILFLCPFQNAAYKFDIYKIAASCLIAYLLIDTGVWSHWWCENIETNVQTATGSEQQGTCYNWSRFVLSSL